MLPRINELVNQAFCLWWYMMIIYSAYTNICIKYLGFFHTKKNLSKWKQTATK